MTDMIVRSSNPYNAEPPLPRLRASPLTATADFYIRSHGAVPQLDQATYRLTITGQVATRLSLSLDDLQQRFPHRTVAATLQCAGNRRADLQPVHPTSGDPWAPGAIGNADWTGIGLADLLRAAGFDTESSSHIAFDAADTVGHDGESVTFGVSIPMRKAGDALLAWAMNGEPLTPEHGFPLRVIVPGYAGVRSPKWLTTITVQDSPSSNPMQQLDYKLLPQHMDAGSADWSQGVTINEMPLNAAICDPESGATVPAGRTTVRGYAIATGRDIARVDLSADGGMTWAQADLAPPASPWCWTFWEATLDLAAGSHELVVRAWDSAGQTPAVPPAGCVELQGLPQRCMAPASRFRHAEGQPGRTPAHPQLRASRGPISTVVLMMEPTGPEGVSSLGAAHISRPPSSSPSPVLHGRGPG